LTPQGCDYRLGRVIPKPAHVCAGLQLADLLAAAVAEPWPECLDLFKTGQIHSWLT
jgi:hypothetical protein